MMEAELASLNKKLVAAGRSTTCRNEYETLTSDEERFSYTLGLAEQYKITPKLRITSKCSELSAKHRKTANELFVSASMKKSRDKILELYTMSIAYAERNSQNLSVAYGNRSALFYNALLYDDCLLDIDRALALDYPEHLRAKIFKRRDDCLASKLMGKRPKREVHDEEKFKPSRPNDNDEIPGVSSSLAISYDEKFGRHIVATRKILPGEVLGVQRGYATILAPENVYTHCSNCLRQTWSSVPCDNCPLAVYCNDRCRNEAWKNHHDVECRVIGAMLQLEFSALGLMCLRLVVRAVRDAGGFEALKKKLELLDSWTDPRTKGFTGTPLILNENDYSSVYTLAKNTEKRSCPDLFGRSFNALFIVYCLATQTDFLGEELTGDVNILRNNIWSMFIGGLITRHLQIIPSNVHAVTESRGMVDHDRGASIIPFLSLFNHKCDNMVMRVHYGGDVVLSALQTIEAGEQVYDNYGMHFAIEELCSRQQRLKRQYLFDCRCQVCEENWPTYGKTRSWTEQGLDREKELTLREALKNFDKYVDLATNGNAKDELFVIKDLELMIKILLSHVKLPCREVMQVIETLKRFYTLRSARFQSLSDSENPY